MARCRSCDAEIIWAVTDSGKNMPLDVGPAERPSGLFTLDTTCEPPHATSAAGQPVYLSHFVTCPNADAHRKSAG